MEQTGNISVAIRNKLGPTHFRRDEIDGVNVKAYQNAHKREKKDPLVRQSGGPGHMF